MCIKQHQIADWINNAQISASEKNISGTVSVHTHEFYELEIILCGSGTYTIDCINYEIKKGTLFLMSPSSFHKIDFKTPSSLINIMFTLDMCNPNLLHSALNGQPHISFNVDDSVMEFLRINSTELIKILGNTAISKQYLFSLFNCVLGKITTLHSENTVGNNISAVQHALLYIHSNFKKQITLEEISDLVNYSDTYFCKKFKEYTGTTFIQYLNNIRFSYSKNMLRYSDFTITQVCQESGFSDFSYFVSSFKKRYKLTPTQYRDNYKQS